MMIDASAVSSSEVRPGRFIHEQTKTDCNTLKTDRNAAYGIFIHFRLDFAASLDNMNYALSIGPI